MLLQGKVCVITGAASLRGIGRATAQLFAAHGATVAILDLQAEQAQQAAAAIGAGHRGYRCDVTDLAQCRSAVEAVAGDLGRVDVLVNNAGITQPRKIMDVTPADYEKITDVHLRGTLYMSQAVIPGMRAQRSGSIVCISSVSAQRGGGIFGGPHYSAAKAGILGLAKAMARELAPEGIRVNSVSPGLIDTDITAGKLTPEMKLEMAKTIPLGRVGQASDVAGACLFLACELSAYLTGNVIDVNGGMHIH